MSECELKTDLLTVVTDSPAYIACLCEYKVDPCAGFKLCHVNDEVNIRESRDVQYHLHVAHSSCKGRKFELPVFDWRSGRCLSKNLGPLPSHSEHGVQSVETPRVGNVLKEAHRVTRRDFRLNPRQPAGSSLNNFRRISQLQKRKGKKNRPAWKLL